MASRAGSVIPRLLLLTSLLASSWTMEPQRAAWAQSSSVLTVVGTDGSLWALPEGQAPALIRADLGAGKVVTDVAWNPIKPELLVVRREMRGDEPYDELVRVDLGMGQEEILEADVGPQARILRPQWGPDGTWGYARIECCLARELLRFSFPTRPGSPNWISANSFLPPVLQDITLAEAGPTTPAGRTLMAVYCCSGPDPDADPSGIYAVSSTLQEHERLTEGTPAEIVGMGPDGSWIAGLRPADTGDGYELVIWRSTGEAAVYPAPAGTVLADRGRVTADGRILLATTPDSMQGIMPRYSSIWSVGSEGTAPRNLTADLQSMATAFDVAPSAVLDMIAPGAGGSPAEIATRVFFGRTPESLDDFSATFPVERGPLSPLAALLALIQGPTMEESAQGYRSDVVTMLIGESSCNGPAELTLAAGAATVRFCREVVSAGIGQDARMAAQVNATLMQFPSIKSVRLLDRSGRCLMDMSGMDLCLRS